MPGQTETTRGSPCWCTSGLPSGEGSPCASSIVERHDRRHAAYRGQGQWEILSPQRRTHKTAIP